MKTMTCRQLGGACDLKFHASTFEGIAAQSKRHGRKMFEKGDEAHLTAMNDMKIRMASPEEMNAWLEIKKKEFEALPEDRI